MRRQWDYFPRSARWAHLSTGVNIVTSRRSARNAYMWCYSAPTLQSIPPPCNYASWATAVCTIPYQPLQTNRVSTQAAPSTIVKLTHSWREPSGEMCTKGERHCARISRKDGLPHDGPVASGPCVGIVTSQSHVSMDTHSFFCLILI